MKKVFLALVGILAAAGTIQAAQDPYGSMRSDLWRSSRTTSQDNFVQISSNPAGRANVVIFHGVFVGTPSANSNVCLYNSTTTNTSLGTVFNSTFAFIDTSVYGFKGPYDVPMSSGLIMNKIGTADVNLFWDYLIPQAR